MEFNFQNLEPYEFQNLSRDIVQIRENIKLETFKEGKDDGIYWRFCNQDKTIILQAKRYKEYASLKNQLKNIELKKVKKLNPKRYILVLALDLSPENKFEIQNIFKEFIKAPSDIITSKDINNYLNDPQYEHIILNYCKLWYTNGFILKETIRSELNHAIIQESKWELDRALKSQNYFVQTKAYYDALEILDNNHCVIISGQPGAGKTTIAYILSLYYLQIKDFDEFIWIKSMSDLLSCYRDDIKQVIVFDDFLGGQYTLMNLLIENLSRYQNFWKE